MGKQNIGEKADRTGESMRVVCEAIGKGHNRQWKVASFHRSKGKDDASSTGMWLSDKTPSETHIYGAGGIIPDTGPDVHSTVSLECKRCRKAPKVILRRENMQDIFDALMRAGIHEVSILRLADIVARKKA